MRKMGMLSAVLVLIAAFLGVKSLTAFGYGAGDIVAILVPMALLVALFFTGLTYVGLWSARRLNRASAPSKTEPPATGETPSDPASPGEPGRD